MKKPEVHEQNLRKQTYTKLWKYKSYCGVFTYHLRKLIDSGAVAKRRDEYSLTSLGMEWTKLTQKMEGEYMKKEEPSGEETEIDMEKWCPMCLETRLKAKVTPKIIRIKCKNPKCMRSRPSSKENGAISNKQVPAM